MAGKSNKLKIKKLQINFTDKWFYTFVVVISLIVIGVFVYAVAPNPGHDITQIAEPSGCSADQFLKWTGSSWTCEAITSSVETDPVWTAASTNVAFINKANAFGAFAQSFDTNVLFVDATNDRVGIGTTSPSYELDVNGDVNADFFIGDGSMLVNLMVRLQGEDDDACDSTNDGLLRYRSSYCIDQDTRTSSFAICMRKSDSFYDWYAIKSYSWSDTCTCPSGTTYFECTGDYVAPGCYASRPVNCFRLERDPR